MIKAIIYDLDGMIFHEPHYFTTNLNKKYDIPSNLTNYLADPNWKKVNLGQITVNEFLKPYHEKWKKYPKFKLSFEGLKKAWFNFSQIDQEMLDLAKKLKKKGILAVIATNNTRERISYLNQKYNLDKIFKIFGSFDLGIMKPNLEYYLLLLKKLKLKPEEILVYDDKKSNLLGLKKIGFKTKVYENKVKFKEDLNRLI